MKLRKTYSLTLATAIFLSLSNNTAAAFDENLSKYTLDTFVVEADAGQDKFGNTVTEQSYYRTGGDVKVITHEEIEKRNYTNLTDAIKRIPGVTFTNAGYRGGEYGYNAYNNSMSINGDSRVIVLIDGRRVDNATSTRFGRKNSGGTRTMVDLDQIINMADVDKIEVIKGTGGSAYGADAVGGVINVITRKGGEENHGTLDLSTGSWNKHHYSLSYSGSAGKNKSWRYFLSLSRDMSGDSQYHDNLTNKDYTYAGTAYKEEGVNIRLDKEFNKKQNLRIWYNHKNGKDGYPITAPDYRYWNQTEWNRIIKDTVDGKFGNTKNPGYRNLFVLDALSGSYNAFRNNDVDITYTFDKQNGMDSFVRIYQQAHSYYGVDRYPEWVDPVTGEYVPFPGSDKWQDFINKYKYDIDGPTTYYDENNKGIQLQYGRHLGKHDILTSVTYDKAKTDVRSYQRNSKTWKTTTVDRNSIMGFIQDKIHIGEKLQITPALRFSHYGTFNASADNGKNSQDNSGSTVITPSINAQYMFDDTASAYLGWSKVHRPIKSADYDTVTPNGAKLQDEDGSVWVIGLRKELSAKTTLGVHYDWTDMSNAVTQYSVWSPSKKDFEIRAVNAREKKQSFNITLDHKFNKNWTVSAAYTHMHDQWSAKDGMQFDPDISMDDTQNVNTMINHLRPQNHYSANITYENKKLYTGLLTNWYTGCSTYAYTKKSFLVLDLNVNYEFTKKIAAYMSIKNLTNEGYENAYSAYNGRGAAPQPGRAFMFGVRYKF